MRDKTPVRPRVVNEVTMQVIFKGGVFEFIFRGCMKKGILLCESRQDRSEFVAMYKNQMTHINVMKKVLWEVIELCAILGRKRLFIRASGSF